MENGIDAIMLNSGRKHAFKRISLKKNPSCMCIKIVKTLS